MRILKKSSQNPQVSSENKKEALNILQNLKYSKCLNNAQKKRFFPNKKSKSG